MRRFELLESRLMLSGEPLIVEGFQSELYAAGSQLSGATPLVAGFTGSWAGATGATVAAGSLVYDGFNVSGANRISLNGSTTLSREFAADAGSPLSNYIDVNGAVGASQTGAPLYFSFLMRVDGSSPPASTFSLYDGGVSSTDREFRLLYSESNASFQAIAGPNGAAHNLNPLNSGVNLFVVKIEFSAGHDVISVWQNPHLDSTESAPDARITSYDIAFDRLAFTRFGGVGSAQFDELRFGSEWSAVTDGDAVGPFTIVAMQQPPPSPTGDGTYPSEFFPFIDQFGQYQHTDWDGKVHSLEELVQSAANEAADLAANPGAAHLNQYGGWLAGPQVEATGYFRTEKLNGKWWLVDPEGRLFFSNGITGVSDAARENSTSAAVKTGVTEREHYFAELPEAGTPAAEFLADETGVVTSGYYQGSRPLAMNFFGANAQTKYGDDWQEISQSIAHDRLKSWGMNTIAAWSDESVYLQQRTPYSMVLFPANPSLINGDGTFPDYFDPAYLNNVKNRILAESGKTLNDPWNIGYFIHNELSWTRSTTQDVDVGLVTLAAASTQHAKIAFRDQLMAKYGSINALNAQWQTAYVSWADFLAKQNVTPNLAGAGADLEAFDSLYALQYFSATSQGMTEAAPNHLYMGARFTGGVRQSAAAAAMEFADVVSINRYGPDVSVLPAGLEGDAPLISGEFHYSANDTGLWSDGLRTAVDQADRADKFAAYLLSALESDRYVGVHWLQYWDFPTAGRINNNNNNSNLGFVSVVDVPYAEMVDAARAIGDNLYELRMGDFAFVVDRTLHLVGDAGDNQFSLAAGGGQVLASRDGVDRQFALSGFDSVEVSVGNGTNRLELSGLNGKEVVLNSSGALTVDVSVSSGSFLLTVLPTIAGVDVAIGSLANVNVTAAGRIRDLLIDGLVTLFSSPAGGVLTAASLTLGTNAQLDVTGNGVVIDYDGPSPLAAVRSAIVGAYSSGEWNGAGITTSYGDAAVSAVGYAESSAIWGPAGGTFMALPVDGTAVLLRHTLYGDANLSGGVDGRDFNRWNSGQGGDAWWDGDFNFDGQVDATDFGFWQANIFQAVANLQWSSRALTPPPEPTASLDPVASMDQVASLAAVVPSTPAALQASLTVQADRPTEEAAHTPETMPRLAATHPLVRDAFGVGASSHGRTIVASEIIAIQRQQRSAGAFIAKKPLLDPLTDVQAYAIARGGLPERQEKKEALPADAGDFNARQLQLRALTDARRQVGGTLLRQLHDDGKSDC